MPTNSLIHATSPYLLQHAENPVAWYQWGEEALKLARESDRPILLSIGYSACHWCHVMAHESFEDEATATLMNELFINIKVDREERPDLDRIYQTSYQLLQQRGGGWPLTMFLTPDEQIPFFAGTYFPKEQRHGLPAFKDLLQQIAAIYRDHKEEIQSQNRSLCQALASMDDTSVTEQESITPSLLHIMVDHLQAGFDWEHGGFGSAPKFPQATNLGYLLRYHATAVILGESTQPAWDMVDASLKGMALGGIYDHLGGGFCRYSVDGCWMIPHFEKMLYDNGSLLSLYSEAWQVGRDPQYQEVVNATAAWVLRRMQSQEGGYYSSLDADSEGSEGEYYVWSREEVHALLTEDEQRYFCQRFGLQLSPNFEGRWHLYIAAEPEDDEEDPAQVKRLLGSATEKLFQARSNRVPPGRDEKILTSWNGLMIKGMATAGRIFGQQEWIASAQQALDFIHKRLWRDGRLLATCKDGHAHLDAYLDDYAFLLDGILALLMASWRDDDLVFAIKLADRLLDKFEDRERGGFFFTSHGHETMFYRPKPMDDESMPAGNGIAAQVLIRLGHVLGEQRYLDAAERTIMAAWEGMEQSPLAHGALLTALDEYLYPPQTVVLRGTKGQLEQWIECCNRSYAPRRFTLAIPNDAQLLPTGLQQRTPGVGVVAYVCEGFACSAPVIEFDAFDALLSDGEI